MLSRAQHSAWGSSTLAHMTWLSSSSKSSDWKKQKNCKRFKVKDCCGTADMSFTWWLITIFNRQKSRSMLKNITFFAQAYSPRTKQIPQHHHPGSKQTPLQRKFSDSNTSLTTLLAHSTDMQSISHPSVGPFILIRRRELWHMKWNVLMNTNF